MICVCRAEYLQSHQLTSDRLLRCFVVQLTTGPRVRCRWWSIKDSNASSPSVSESSQANEPIEPTSGSLFHMLVFSLPTLHRRVVECERDDADGRHCKAAGHASGGHDGRRKARDRLGRLQHISGRGHSENHGSQRRHGRRAADVRRSGPQPQLP